MVHPSSSRRLRSLVARLLRCRCYRCFWASQLHLTISQSFVNPPKKQKTITTSLGRSPAVPTQSIAYHNSKTYTGTMMEARRRLLLLLLLLSIAIAAMGTQEEQHPNGRLLRRGRHLQGQQGFATTGTVTNSNPGGACPMSVVMCVACLVRRRGFAGAVAAYGGWKEGQVVAAHWDRSIDRSTNRSSARLVHPQPSIPIPNFTRLSVHQTKPPNKQAPRIRWAAPARPSSVPPA